MHEVPPPTVRADDARLRLAVTGTDTGVGKTVVTCALLSALRARGCDVGGMKPVETGVVERHAGTDAARIRRAAGGVHRAEDVCPFTFPDPLSPHIAARRAGASVDVQALDRAFARVECAADAVIVEGAGGLLAPLTPALALADLAARWRLDLVVVAANRLGVINHLLLTVREAERRGLVVRGVVLNACRRDAGGLAAATNEEAVRELLPGVPLAPLPWLGARVEHADTLTAAGEALLDALALDLAGSAASPPGRPGAH
jgi:dethiobiotin synthetase